MTVRDSIFNFDVKSPTTQRAVTDALLCVSLNDFGALRLTAGVCNEFVFFFYSLKESANCQLLCSFISL